MIAFDPVVGVLLHNVPRIENQLVEDLRVGRARSVVTSLGRLRRVQGRAKNRRVAARSRFGDARTSMTCLYWSITRYRYTQPPGELQVGLVENQRSPATCRLGRAASINSG
jgi:hypothetical protein